MLAQHLGSGFAIEGSNDFSGNNIGYTDEVCYEFVGRFCINIFRRADLLNVALFGVTAKIWRDNNPDQKGNIRDYATLEQLVVLSNMESINALLIQQGLSQSDRLIQLNKVAITQMKSLLGK